MGADAVEEPAVVADDYRTACESLQAFLQSTQGIDVDVVGRLVEQEHVALLLKRHGQVQTIAFATRKHAAEFVLVGTVEVEAAQISVNIDVASAHADQVVATAHHVVDRLVGLDVLVLLIDVGKFHGLAFGEGAAVGFLQAHDEAEEGCLARTVGADDAHDAVGRQHEVEVLEEHLVAESLGHMHGFEHLVAQTWTIRDEDLELLLAFLLLLVEHLVVGVESGLALGLSCLGCHAHPFELALQGLATLRGGLLLLCHALGLLVEPARIVALPRDAFAAVEFEDPLRNVVEEVTVVGDGNHRTLVLLQVLFQPVDALGIEVVGGLVEQEHVGFLQ